MADRSSTPIVPFAAPLDSPARALARAARTPRRRGGVRRNQGGLRLVLGSGAAVLDPRRYHPSGPAGQPAC
jgi:hypothetical protein